MRDNEDAGGAGERGLGGGRLSNRCAYLIFSSRYVRYRFAIEREKYISNFTREVLDAVLHCGWSTCNHVNCTP